MKVVNSICRVLALVFGVGALVLFFLNFVSITTSGELIKITGAQLGFGGRVSTATMGKVDLAKSSQILFCLLLTALSAVFSAFSFKFKWTRIAAPIVALISGIYMLVISLGNPVYFVDYRPLTNVVGLAYDPIIYFATAAVLSASAFGIASIFLTNYIEVKESKGTKKTIIQHIVSFLREYKSEIKKIVWPGPRSVVKNTTIVLIICTLVGAFIWLLDFGLSALFKLILGT